MVDERESPSAGWCEVYDEMEAESDVEAATHRCPDCGQQCENVLRDVYECEDHGIFRASASDGDSGESDAEEGSDSKEQSDAQEGLNAEREPDRKELEVPDELENRSPGKAD